MAGVSDKALITMGPWPLGMVNLGEEGHLPTDEDGNRLAVRDAVNVDFDAQGFPSRRAGYTEILTGSLTHSLWSDDALSFGLFVDEGQLCVLHTDDSADTLGVEVGNLPLSYALIGDRIYWSNRNTCGLVTLDLQVWSWAPEDPAGQPLLDVVDGFGLSPGLYQVAVTFTDLLGRESGATLASMIEVGEGQGIALSGIPAPLDLTATPTVNVYCTGPNDQVLKLYTRLPAGISSGTIAQAAQGITLTTQFLRPLPAGQIVRLHNGRQVVARGKELFWSQPLRYGMFNPVRNRILFPHDIDAMEPAGGAGAGAGIYVAAGPITYWLGGIDPNEFSSHRAYSYGAVPGTSATIPGDAIGLDSKAPVTVWMARSGHYVVGVPGGSIMALKEGEAVIDDADAGATLFRTGDGIQQLLTALRAPMRQGLAVTDRAIAHVIHQDA